MANPKSPDQPSHKPSASGASHRTWDPRSSILTPFQLPTVGHGHDPSSHNIGSKQEV
eukprot:CAMPEP_0114312592 /NCGR_PEP_ID=MMETSP0059-20121206/20544_1 /TAXON_ID=36894 /ORGANISM="Pyramimonas parkeae, Strain CCMP726" /LENGTH=56 /DNA_ID=CAMNT_0001437051 /DNA_START=194 /DNA_END=364 /DNA_ORIENTATION=+